ncbi:hypothetical protein QJS04_geneDACA000836 [Acorus gramineus]|uniref:Uncharacterized protein n=1 Tax=Acorus gramineus TaxID=55184 RepID=A0AAV9BEP9_ACOGR|nr:hypothetical protein QJS04_geneDACA000836 [Acorus gramineus]
MPLITRFIEIFGRQRSALPKQGDGNGEMRGFRHTHDHLNHHDHYHHLISIPQAFLS